MCVRSFCASHSETAFSYLVEHVKQNKIKQVPGMDVADLLYIMSWVSLMNSHDKGTSKKSSDQLTLISGLKLALIMSSKAPEIFRKVAQLMAILYALLPNIDLPLGAPSACQWSCFCHQLTLGSNMDSIFSSQLKELYHGSDPDVILNSLAPNLDVDLEEFVAKYFEALPPHTILGMTILNDKYMDLLEILLEESSMPSKYGAHLMMSRYKSKGKPRVVLLPVEAIKVFDGSEDCPSMFRGTGRHRRCSWGTKTIVDKIVPGFQKLTDYIAFSFVPKGKYTKQDVSSLLAWKTYLDKRVCDLVSRMEKWFGKWKHILLGEDMSGCHSGTSQEEISIFPKKQRGGNARSLSKEPVIMLLDFDINMLPWESMPVLRNQEIYRMPSISSIFYMYYRLIHSDKKKVKDSTIYPVLNPRDAYYVVNPDGTRAFADPTEIYVAHQLRKIHNIKGKSFESVDADEILNKLVTGDFYLYMGHGNGFQYIPRAKVVNLLRCAAATLMGCDSALLVLNGSYIPSGAPLDYIIAGSPIAIGNLWNVFPHGSGIVLMALYESWIGDMSQDGEPGIGSFLVKARDSSKLVFKYLDGAASVCYGIPTQIYKEKPRRRELKRRLNVYR